MNAREIEAALLDRCLQVASSANASARDQREANVFRLASMVLASAHPASKRLALASERYFAMHPDERLDGPEVVAKGWVLSLPRLKETLLRETLGHHYTP